MIVAGFGASRRAATASFRSALAAAAAGRTVTALAIPETKAGALDGLAEELGLPVIRIDAAAIALMNTPTQSARSRTAFGTGSVAEACALAGAGRAARLIGPRAVSADRLATCALAEGDGA